MPTILRAEIRKKKMESGKLYTELTRNSALPRLCCEPPGVTARSATIDVEKLLLVWCLHLWLPLLRVPKPDMMSASLSFDVQISGSSSRFGDWLMVRCLPNREIRSVRTQSWLGLGCRVIVCSDLTALKREKPSSMAAAHKWSGGMSLERCVSMDCRSEEEPRPEVVGVLG